MANPSLDDIANQSLVPIGPSLDDIASSSMSQGNNSSSVSPQLKSLLPSISPGMWQSNPGLSAIGQTAQDAVTIPANYVNQLLNNQPRAMLNRLGYSFPDTSNLTAKDAANLAGVVGMIESPINKLIGGMQGIGMAGKGMLTGLSYAPTQASSLLDDIKQRGQQALLGAVIGQIGEAAKPIVGAATNLFQNFTKIQDPLQFAQAIRSNLFANKQAAGQAFEKGIVDNMSQYPDAKVDLSDEFQSLKDAMDNNEENPGLAVQIKGIIKKTTNPDDAKLLSNLINDPQQAANLSLQDSQTVKTAINKAPAIATKLSQGRFANWSPAESELLDLTHNVTSKQLDAYPQFSETKAAYANYIQSYNQVKNAFKPASLLNKIRGGFGNEEVEQAVQNAIGTDSYNAISQFRNAYNAQKNLKNLPGEAIRDLIPAGIGAGLYAGGEALLGAHQK